MVEKSRSQYFTAIFKECCIKYIARRIAMNNQTEILSLIMSPAFIVNDGVITECNDGALRLLFSAGEPIRSLLPAECDDYHNFRTGCLFLTLHHNEHRFGCTVVRVDKSDIFILDQDEDRRELKTLALTASNLRQPLSAMIATAGNLFPLIEQSEDPKVKTQIDHMNRSLCQMHRMLCNMTDTIQYAEASDRPLICQNIVSVVDAIFQQAQLLAAHCGIDLQFTVPNEDIYCAIDEQLLERGIYNMVSNALKFSEQGSVVTAALFRRNNTLFISVQDRGCGIPGAVMGDVFQRYLRQPGLEDGRFGLGLGLALVRSAARIHNGTVLIDQPESVGTRVTVSIPIQQGSQTLLRSNVAMVDYAGGWNHGLLELSDVLPAHLYRTDN